MPCSIRGRVAALIITGLLLAVSGVAFFMFFPPYIKYRIRQALILSEASESFKYWEEPAVPIYTKFYFFNVLNPEDIYLNNSKPVLEELGPYTFRERKQKVNITWHDNGTVSYHEKRIFFYRPDLSKGTLDDIVTTVNVPLLGSYFKVKEFNSVFFDIAIEAYMESSRNSWFVTKTAGELLFEGYADPLLDAAQKFTTLPFDKFGWMYKSNGTSEGLITMMTGRSGFSKIGKIVNFNGSPYIGSWDPPCNRVNGSAGQLFSQLYNVEKISIFIPKICRELQLKFLESKDYQGITAFRYYGDDTGFDNGQKVPENKCYCNDGKCLPSGAHDLSTCPPGAPAAASFPHFLFADSSYIKNVQGLKPDPKKHLTFLDINPDTGITLNGSMQFQINLAFETTDENSRTTKRIYLPAFWASSTFEMPDDLKNKLRFILYTVPLIIYAISFFLVGFGSALTVCALILAIVYKYEKERPIYSKVHYNPVRMSEFSGNSSPDKKALNGRTGR